MNTKLGDLEYLPEEPQILAIAAASAGWRAVLAGDEPHQCSAPPILAWAVIRRAYTIDGERGFEMDIAPVVADLRANSPHGTAIASLWTNFVGVAAPGEDPSAVLARHHVAEMFEMAFGELPVGQA